VSVSVPLPLPRLAAAPLTPSITLAWQSMSSATLHGIRVRGDDIGEDEVVVIEGVPATTPSRTALDLGCCYPRSEAVAAIDALARATDLKMPDVDLLA
jgi:hypothetical protein